MSLLSVAKEKTIDRWLEIGVGLLVLLLVSIYFWLENQLLTLVTSLPTVWLLRSMLVLLVFAISMFACVLSFRPKLTFLPELGLYQDRRRGMFYCPSCKHLKNVHSPLKCREDGWFCVVKECRQLYPNPSYIRNKR